MRMRGKLLLKTLHYFPSFPFLNSVLLWPVPDFYRHAFNIYELKIKANHVGFERNAVVGC